MLKEGRDSGYTLLELMISITMISFIVLILGGAMRLGFRSVDSGERRIDSLERFKTSFNIVSSQIQSGVPLTYNDNGSTKYTFQGDRDSLQFSTNNSLWDSRRGYVAVAYRVTSDESGKQSLSLSESTVGVGDKREAVLFDSLDAVYFEYFFKDPTEEKGQWVERWPAAESIPEKIRLNLVSGQKKLSLIVPVRVKARPGRAGAPGSF